MKSLKFLSLWAIPMFLFLYWGKSNLSTNRTTNAADPCPPLVCKDSVNVSLNEGCEVILTPFMLVNGDSMCLKDLKVEVFDAQNHSLGNHITSAYNGQTLRYQVSNPANGDNCWGHITLQDNTPPDLICPEPTVRALTTAYANKLIGDLSEDDLSFSRNNFPCWLSNETQEPGDYYLDTLSFRVAKDGIYTFVLITNFAQAQQGAGAIFQDAFYFENPCQNIIGFTKGGSLVNNTQNINDWWIQTPGLGDYLPWLDGNVNRPYLRIELELKKGTTYYLATTSLKPEDTGDFAWLAFRDEVTQEPNTDILVDQPIINIPWLVPLVCEDANNIKISGNQCYKTDAEGKVVAISNDLRDKLQLTGFPHNGYPWFQRGGAVSDNCGDIQVCVSDAFRSGIGSCDDVLLDRKFTAKDASGHLSSCIQTITIRKPTAKDIILPNYTAYIECDETYPIDSLGNPHPSVTGYPFVKTAFGFKNLAESFCNISATYADKNRVNLCDKAFTFIRVWTIYDWCNPGNTFFYNQIIKVGDFTPPKVVFYDNEDDCIPTYSTGPFNCFASIVIPAPDTITDNCSGWKVTVDVIIVQETPVYNANGEIEDYEETEQVLARGKKPGDIVNNVPMGVHYFRYRAEDDCKNISLTDYYFQVLDRTEPIAVCNNSLTVSLGGTSKISKILATDVDEGSFDNCSNIKLEVRRVVDEACLDEYEELTGDVLGGDGGDGGPAGGGGLVNNNTIDSLYEEEDTLLHTEWRDFVYITCCDIGQKVRIELRVWDDADGNGIPGEFENVDYCGFDIEDNYNICWLDVLVEDKAKPSCKPPFDVSISCLDPRILHTSDFSCADSILLDSFFGRFIATDNCEAFMVCDDVIDNRDNCGTGTITRIYHAEDYSGNVSAPCQQVITVMPGHNYEIMFPADVAGQCDVVRDTVIGLNEIGCDLLAVNVQDERFSVPTGECFKIFRTFRIINWCEFDGISSPIIIGRDEDCDGVLGDEPVYILRRPGANNAQPAFIDRNANELDNNPKAGERGAGCDPNPKGYWRKSNSVGYWQYTQMIRVYDTIPPELYPSPVDLFCSSGADCQADIGIPFLVNEECTPQTLTFEEYVDLYNDSIDFFRVEGAHIRGSYPKFTFEYRFPIGKHTVEIRVGDGCGNVSSFKVPFEVADCKAPTITCVNGLSVELTPVIPATDVNGDGTPDNAFAEIWATDYIKSMTEDCSDSVRYSINRVGETPDINQKRLVFTCADAGNTIPIEVYAWDDADNPRVVKPNGTVGGPNSSNCITYIEVQDNIYGTCGGAVNSMALSGLIATPNGRSLPDAAIQITNATNNQANTDENGRYVASVPVFANDIVVTPSFDERPLDGVSTFDIVQISQHILGIKPFDSPYKYIAADVNNSGSVTILDVILLRKLILGIDVKFPNNTSWRFVDKKYNFPVGNNPWYEQFPETLRFHEIKNPINDADFVAIKTGDIDFNAIPNSSRDAKFEGTLGIFGEDKKLTPGQEVSIPFSADLTQVNGYQFAMQFNTDALELSDMDYGVAQLDNFGWRFVDKGIITTSWNNPTGKPYNGSQRLFTLIFKVKKPGKLSEFLQLSNRYTPAEAYSQSDEMLNVQLGFGDASDPSQFVLMQNQPNPFANETVVGFYAPKSAKVLLKVFTSDGRLVHTEEGTFEQGYQEMRIRRSDLLGAGVYFYTLEANGWKAVRRMVMM